MTQGSETNVPEIPQQEQKNQFERLLEKLQQREDIIVAGVYPDSSTILSDFKQRYPDIGEWLHIAIAPKTPKYTPEEQDALLDELSGYLSPVAYSVSPDYCWKYKGELMFGNLYYNETIAKKQVVENMEEVEPGILARLGLQPKRIVQSYDIIRKTSITLYPHPYLADIVSKYKQSLTTGMTEWDRRFSSLSVGISKANLDKLKNMQQPTPEVFGFLPGPQRRP